MVHSSDENLCRAAVSFLTFNKLAGLILYHCPQKIMIKQGTVLFILFFAVRSKYILYL